MGVELGEFEDGESLGSALVIKRTGIADFALQQLQIRRVERELQASLWRGRRRVDRAARVVWPFVYEKRALELNLAAQAATIALAALVSFIAINQIIRQDVG